MSIRESQITDNSVCFIVCLGYCQRKHQSPHHWLFVNQWSVAYHRKGPVMRKMFPFHKVIMHIAKIKCIVSLWVSIKCRGFFFCFLTRAQFGRFYYVSRFTAVRNGNSTGALCTQNRISMRIRRYQRILRIQYVNIMTPWHGKAFCISGILWRKALTSDGFLEALVFSFLLVWTGCWKKQTSCQWFEAPWPSLH